MMFLIIYICLMMVSGMLLFVGWTKHSPPKMSDYSKTDVSQNSVKNRNEKSQNNASYYGYGAGYMILSWLHFSVTDMQLQQKRLLQIATKEDLKKQIREERIKACGILVWGVFLCSIIGLLYCVVQERSEKSILLAREEYGGTETVYDLNVAFEQGTTEQIEVAVQPMEYSRKEIEQFFEDAFQQAWVKVLGDNESFAQVDSSLNLVASVKGNPITLSWWWEDGDCLSDDGEVNIDYVGEGKDTILFLEAKYMDDVRQQSQPIHVCPPIQTKYELLLKKVVEEISGYEQKDKTSKVVEIPSVIEGGHVSLVSNEANPEIFIALIIGMFVFMYLKKKQDLEESLKDREADLMKSYPNLIQKLLLYLGAGMTLKQCFEQIYMEHKDQWNEKDGYVYKEIGAMVHELKSGVSEVNSYETWGAQLQVPCYLKLVTILTQNLSKGNQDMLRILKQEMLQALRERQEFAKKQGEEASTKLLFPMLILLMVTIVIVVVPAFMNFSM